MEAKRIDINCDMGESYGAYRLGMDAEVIRYITSANVACGYHAGDPQVMDRTVKLAKEHGVGVGAHPGYPDLVGFGRRNMECTPEEVRDFMIYQIGALQGFCAFHGVPLQHVKPHGSLYNMCVGNETLSVAVAEAIAAVDPGLIWVTLGGAQADLAKKVAAEAGIRVLFEAFPDRAYTPDGKLASRKLPGAVIEDPKRACEQALRMAKESAVIALDGTRIEMEVHTLCVHGDNPSAVDHVKTIRQALEAEGLRIVRVGAPD
ncbi:MAG: 5-oxoprolinase subunit PxpA [Deltaproteobacteria bacterium]|nr:5-oxoprolinase subunit PxpA [Deltaproteobacteria bacterium]